MSAWCFTFGCGSPLARYYVEIEAPSEHVARLQMFAWFTQHWAGCYPAETFARQIAEHGYQRLDIPPDASLRLKTNFDELPLEVLNEVQA